MAEYDNTNRGSFFINEDKKTDKAPDYSGTLNVEGKEYRLAGWKRESKNGKKFLSLQISEPQGSSESGSKKDSSNDGW